MRNAMARESNVPSICMLKSPPINNSQEGVKLYNVCDQLARRVVTWQCNYRNPWTPSPFHHHTIYTLCKYRPRATLSRHSNSTMCRK